MENLYGLKDPDQFPLPDPGLSEWELVAFSTYEKEITDPRNKKLGEMQQRGKLKFMAGPDIVFKDFPISYFGENAQFPKICTALNGGFPLVPEEQRKAASCAALIQSKIGTNFMLNIVHNPGKDGRIWANVDAIMPIKKGKLGESGKPIKMGGAVTLEDAAQIATKASEAAKKLKEAQEAVYTDEDDIPF